MAEVHRRAMLQLADGIRKYQADGTVTETIKGRLNSVLELTSMGSKFVGTSDILVDAAKLELCTVCRRDSLHKCDTKLARSLSWSDTCAFVRTDSGGREAVRRSDKPQ